MNEIQRKKGLQKIGELKKLISDHRRDVCRAFHQLDVTQRRILLDLSGIRNRALSVPGSVPLCYVTPDFSQLSDDEVDSLSKGLSVLKSIIHTFEQNVNYRSLEKPTTQTKVA